MGIQNTGLYGRWHFCELESAAYFFKSKCIAFINVCSRTVRTGFDVIYCVQSVVTAPSDKEHTGTHYMD